MVYGFMRSGDGRAFRWYGFTTSATMLLLFV